MKIAKNTIIVTVVLVVFINILSAINPYTDKNVQFFFDRCIGKCNKDYCRVNISCRPYNRTSKLRILDIQINDGVVIEAPINIDIISYKKFRTEYKQYMLKLNGELCEQIKAKNHPVLYLFSGHGTLGVNGTLFQPCPMSGHRFVYPQYTSSFPIPLVPTGDWKLDFILSKNINGTNTHLLTATYYVTVKATSATEF